MTDHFRNAANNVEMLAIQHGVQRDISNLYPSNIQSRVSRSVIKIEGAAQAFKKAYTSVFSDEKECGAFEAQLDTYFAELKKKHPKFSEDQATAYLLSAGRAHIFLDTENNEFTLQDKKLTADKLGLRQEVGTSSTERKEPAKR